MAAAKGAPPRRLAPLGYLIDAAIIALWVALASRHPVWDAIKTAGGISAWAAGLPTPLVGANATGLVVTLAAENPGWLTPAAAVRAQEVYNYVLGNDLGAGVAEASPDVAYFHAMNVWKNELLLPSALTASLPHFMATWLRNMVAGWGLFFGVGFAWSIVIYGVGGARFFPDPTNIPSMGDLLLHMRVSSGAMVFYTLAPTVSEWAIERGFTHVYKDLDAVGGWSGYLLLFVAYMTFVEWGIYWVHRLLHDIPWGYTYLHRVHHIYNSRHSLSPFAGLAFHPVDGLCQASPYVIGMFLMPVHFWTHEALLFFTAIWTTAIHDTLQGDSEPIMGAAYHTIHHTTYKDNYGQILVLFDYLHDTLLPPPSRQAEWHWKKASSLLTPSTEGAAPGATDKLKDE